MIHFQPIMLAAVRKLTELPPVSPAPHLAQSPSIHSSLSGSPGYFLALGAGILEEI